MAPDPILKIPRLDRINRISPPSIVKMIHGRWGGEDKAKEVPRPDEETLKRLNEIAKAPPFGTYYKNKKYDTL